MSNATFWDKAAPKYAQDKISDMDGYMQTLGRMRHHLQPDHHVLEIGCGTGSTALELAPGVASYKGTDISDGMIKIACAKLDPDAPQNLSFAATTDIPNGQYDAILALNLLHLLPDMEGTLRKIHSALPSGGLFIAKTGLLREGKWFLSLIIPPLRMIGKAPYVRALTEQELTAALTWTGFEPVETIKQKGIAPRLFTIYRKP